MLKGFYNFSGIFQSRIMSMISNFDTLISFFKMIGADLKLFLITGHIAVQKVIFKS